MTLQPFLNEELNFFKFASIVLDEFPKALRQIFVGMWDKNIASLPGYQPWDDSATVRNLFLKSEGGRTKIPTNVSIQHWDCTALFQATLYAQTFALPDTTGHKQTLGELYLKKRKPVPGLFHSPVASPSGDPNETTTLAIDQLRLLRNTLCHSSSPRITKATFDQYVRHAKEALTSVNLSTSSLEAICSLAESDFPTARVRQLENMSKTELGVNYQFLKSEIKDQLDDLTSSIKDVNECTQGVKRRIDELVDQHDKFGQKIDEEEENAAKTLKETTRSIVTAIDEQRSAIIIMIIIITIIALYCLSTTVSVLLLVSFSVFAIRKKFDEPILKQKTTRRAQEYLPKPFFPSMVPHFTGRQSECKEAVRRMTSQSTRLVSILGPPGFGKTSVAIAVAYRLKNQGLPVYFFSLRNMKTTNDLASKLLNWFMETSSYQRMREQSSHSGAADELCHIFAEISSNIFIVLDNADDLLESGGSDTRQEVSDLLLEIFMRCKKVTFLCTTRMSLDFLKLKFQDQVSSIKIGPLDKPSSNQLVQQLLPKVNDDDCERITQICGCVPLAVKLLCALIVEDDEEPNQVLNEFCSSSVSLLHVLDNPDTTNDLRLKVLFESSFKRLSQGEKEAFVSLSVFVGEKFDMSAAVEVIGGNKVVAKQILQRLQRKCLLDFNPDNRFFSFHSLIRTFAIEKGENEMKEIAFQAKARFYSYHVLMFKDLNNQFQDRNSLSAFAKCYQEKENIFLSLVEGLSNDSVCDEILNVLPTAELFLDTIMYFNNTSIFRDIYNSAIRKATERHNIQLTHQLLVAKSFGEITWNKQAITPKLLKKAEEIEKENPSLIPKDAKGKRLCYQGIHLLINGKRCPGSKMLENGATLLSSCSGNKILKFVTFQILALYYNSVPQKSATFIQLAFKECEKTPDLCLFFLDFSGDITEMSGNEIKRNDDPCSSNQPLILALVWLLNCFRRKYFLPNNHEKLKDIVSEMQGDILRRSQNNHELLPLLRYIDRTLIKLNEDEDCHHSLQCTLDTIVKNYGEQHDETANTYQTIGQTQYKKGDYAAALESHQKALKIRLTLYGEQHVATAESYHFIGVTQHAIKDYVSALKSKQQALNIRLKLYGEHHATTANSYYSIGITQDEMKDHDSASQSKQRAREIRFDLQAEEHAALDHTTRYDERQHFSSSVTPISTWKTKY